MTQAARDSVLEAPPSTHAPTAPPGALQPQVRSQGRPVDVGPFQRVFMTHMI